jgi:uncharacterized secreted protein with C-terminal beta-propeller domain
MASPTSPKVVGELEVPGFSTYIHPLGEDHLITIGEGGNPQGEAWGGVALSIFDISDFGNPVRTHFQNLGIWGADSEAKFDHHAFLYYEPFELLAIPLQSNNFEGGPFSGILAAHVNPTDGFELGAAIDHSPIEGEAGSAYYSGDSTPRRSVVIDEYLISISDLGLVVTELNTWEDVNIIELPWQGK